LKKKDGLVAKRFRFRFETMLKIRRQREDQHKRVVAERLGEIRQVQQELERVERLTNEGLDTIRAVQQFGRIDMQQAMAQRGWVTHLHKTALNAEAQLRGLEARLAQERAALAEAAKQRRIIEKLKERQLSRHRIEEQRIETLMTDDLTTTRYVFEAIDRT
jgi:flagellar protein FliJ